MVIHNCVLHVAHPPTIYIKMSLQCDGQNIEHKALTVEYVIQATVSEYNAWELVNLSSGMVDAAGKSQLP